MIRQPSQTGFVSELDEPTRRAVLDLQRRIAELERQVEIISTAPAVTGSRGGNAALASLLAALVAAGLIVDSTTA